MDETRGNPVFWDDESVERDWRSVNWQEYLASLRAEGRRFRPGKVYDRPSTAEAQAGKPASDQLDIFNDTPNGRAATRLSRVRKAHTATHELNAVQATIIRLDTQIRLSRREK